jgi:hypothetical protein
MRRIVSSPWSREECLRRAREDEWLAQQCRSAAGAAELFDRIRLWRSLALVAAPEHPTGPAGGPSPGSPPALASFVQPPCPMPGAADPDVGCALRRCPLYLFDGGSRCIMIRIGPVG